MQNKVEVFCEKYNLKSDASIRSLDLVSEVRELCKEVIKGSDYGTKDFKKTDNLALEIGDTLFSLCALCNELDIDMDEALNKVLDKYENRFKNKGTISSSK